VQASFTALLKLEVFHRVGDEYLLAIQPRVPERPVEHASGRSDERSTPQIFIIARLFTYEHQASQSRALAWHHLRSRKVQRTAGAGGFGSSKSFESDNIRSYRSG
jgi:hypothetical protein